MRHFHIPVSRPTTRRHSQRTWARSALLAAAVALSAGSLALGAQQTVVWTGGGSGAWETAGNWTPNVIPDNSTTTYAVQITNGGPSATVTMNNSHTIDALSLDAGSILDIANAQTLTFATNATITNNGTINLNYNTGGNQTQITFDGNLLSGAGVLNLDNGANTAQLTGAFTQDTSHTIAGLGAIIGTFTNNGTVNANVNGGAMTLSTSAMNNNKTFEATNGGILNISGIAVTQGANGKILASGTNLTNLSTVELTGGTTISGGTLNTASGGLIINSGGANTLSGVTNNGTFEVANSTETDIVGNLVDNGSIIVNYNQGGNTTILSFNGGTLSGSGTITLNNANNQAEINGSLTQSSGHTIAGQGEINAVLTNNGLVNANVSGGTLSLLAATLTNTATLEATNSGTLHFGSGIAATNTGGTVTANGGNVLFDGSAALTGGTLTSSGTNFIETNGASFTTFTLSTGSVIQVDNNSNTDFTGTITNNGNIVVNPTQQGNATTVTFHGTASLTGSGTLTLNNGANQAQLNTADSSTVTQGANHTIQGQGQINAAFTNNGTVNANVNAGTLTLQTNAMTNNSLMEATNSGSLNIGGITVTQGSSGNIKADGGSVSLTGSATISGGTLNTANGGVIYNSAGANTLDSLTNNADFRIANGQQTNVTGDLVDNGAITVNYTAQGNNTVLSFNGGTVSGSGAIILNSTTSNAQLTGSLTQSSGHTIEGFGQITAALTNNGIVNANVSGQTLTLMTNNMTNNNLFEATAPNAATNVGTLNISGITITQGANGEILADGANGANNSTVNLTGNTTISGGTIATTNGGVIFNSSGANTLDSLTSNADFRIANGTTTNVTGDLADNGTITVNYTAQGNTTILSFNGGTLSGSGAIILNSTTSNAQLTGSLTQSSGHTIEGFGLITATLINQGLVNANSAGNTLEIKGTSATNTSTLEATAGTLQFDSSIAVTNTGGTILANGGNVVFNDSANVTNGILTSASPNFLESDNAAFTGITLSTGSLLQIGNGTTTNFTGAITDNGSILVNYQQSGNTTIAVFNGSASLAGAGTLTLNSSGANAELNTASLATLTQNSQHTIDGFGAINAALTNNGTVNADVSGQTLTLQTNAMSNSSLIEATNSGILNIGGITLTQTGVGQIKADGGTVNLIGATTISGGVLNSANGGAIVNSAGGNTLDSLTNNADFRINNGLQTNVTGDLVDNGTITVNYQAGGNNTVLNFNGGTLSGSGAIILNSGGSNAQLTGSLTQSSGHTIEGFGQITATLTNQGLVNANVNSTVLAMPTANSNTGTYEASNGGILDITGDVAQDDAATAGVLTAGTYEALANSTLAITLPAQPLTQIGSNAVVILNGTFSIFTSGEAQIDTTLTTNNGELHVINRTFNALAFTNGGLLQLGGGGGSSAGGGVFSAPSLLNTGTIQATGAGNVLSITAGITDPITGVITVDAGASLDISGGGAANTTAFLNQNGALNIGANNITVLSDYTNANFDTTLGNPNTFNKHANVTGTGQILAAPGTAGLSLLSVSGTGVSNGTTATPTISGVNAHVGVGSTYNFQLNNTGTAGSNPTIRGAIQNTGVGDADLTVAAANYVLAPGANTSFSVTFTPTAAGPIAAGQTVHIANNFDNVTEQDVTLTGAGYALASTDFNTTTVTLPSIRVGGAFASQSLSVDNTLAASIYNETLGAQFANASGVTTSGSPITVVAGAPASTALTVSLPGADNATAGLQSGTVDVQFNSQAVNGSGLGTTSLSALNKTVTVSASVYNVAVPNTLATPVNLGIIHPNQNFANTALSISNNAPTGGFSEGLDASVTGTTGGGSFGGSIINLAAGSSNTITIGLANADTSTAGSKTGAVTVGFSTDGATTSLLAAAPITGPTGSQTVTINGQVNNYASPAFHQTAGSGTLSNDGVQATSYTLDFGTQTALASGSATLSLENLLVAADPSFQDSLGGTFTITSGAGTFQLFGFNNIADGSALAAGAAQSAGTVSFANLNGGSYDETITFTPNSTNASSDSAIPGDASVALNITLDVTPGSVPEPASLALLGLGAAALLKRRRGK